MESHDAIKTASSALSEMSAAMRHIDDMKKTAEAAEGLSKLAKASAAFSVLSVGLDIGLAMFGPEDPKEQMLKMAIKMLADLEKRVDQLSQDVEDGFSRVSNEVRYLSAQAQVFSSVAMIKPFHTAVAHYWDAVHRRNQSDIEHYEEVIRAYSVADLRTAMEEILESCRGTKETASNVLVAATMDSLANFRVVRDLGTSLVATTVAGSLCAATYWRVLHKNDPEKISSAQEAIKQDYGAWLDGTADAVSERIKECAAWDMVKRLAERKVKDLVKGLPATIDSAGAAKRIIGELAEAYPDARYIVFANTEDSQQYWTNFLDYGLDCVQVHAKSPGGLGVVVWITAIPPASLLWDVTNDKLAVHVSAYAAYFHDSNLHRYKSDAPEEDRPFGYKPFALVGHYATIVDTTIRGAGAMWYSPCFSGHWQREPQFGEFAGIISKDRWIAMCVPVEDLDTTPLCMEFATML